MGLLKNDDRRLAQKAPKKPKNPLRDPVRATAAGPVKAAETTVLDGLSAEGRAGAAEGRAVVRAVGYAFLDRDLPGGDQAPAGGGAPSAREAPSARTQAKAAVGQSESEAFALHMDAEPRLRRRTAPAP